MTNYADKPHCMLEIQSSCDKEGISYQSFFMTDFLGCMDSQLIDVALLINAFLGEYDFDQPVHFQKLYDEFTANGRAWTDADMVEHRIMPDSGELLDAKYVEAMYVVVGKFELPILSFSLTLDRLFNAFMEIDLPTQLKNPSISMEKLVKYNKPLAHIVQTFAKWIENGHKSISTEMYESMNDSYFPYSTPNKVAS